MIDKLPALGVISGVLISLIPCSVQAAVSYAPPVSTSVGTADTAGIDNPEYIAKGDLDGSGGLDLVTANETDGTITVLLNDGAGGFSSVETYDTVGNLPRQIAIGDIDGDGDNDLLVPNVGNTLTNAVAVFLNNGDGSFATALTIDLSALGSGAEPTSPVIADFNGDTALDAAVSTAGTNQIQILISDGDGTFTLGTPLATGAKPSYIAAGDLDDDGNTDLVVANFEGDSISVFLGNGDGTFTEETNSPIPVGPSNSITGDRPWTIHIASIDSSVDSIPDLIFANYNPTGAIRLFKGVGDGSFVTSNPIVANVPDRPHGIEVADLDGDTVLDLAVASDADGAGADPIIDSALTVLLGDGTGAFTGTSFSLGPQPNGVVAVNLDNIPLVDLAIANAKTGNVDVFLSVPTANAPVAEDGILAVSSADVTAGNPQAGTLPGSDADGALLSYTITTAPLNGTISFTNPSAGEYTYTPTGTGGSYTLPDSFQYTANDGTGASAAATIQVVQNDPPTITSNANVSVPENQTAVTTVTATDPDTPAQPLTFSISGGADAGKFVMAPNTGILTFATAPDFEAPTDQGGDNVYNVQVQVSDGNGGTATQDIAVTVTDVNDAPANQPPTITSDGGAASAAVTVPSGQTAVTTVTATDPNAGQTVTYSISGGADAAQFTINGTSGALAFATAPDVANPTDAGGDNVYNVQVRAADNGTPSLSDTQDIAVTVAAVDSGSSGGGGGGGCAIGTDEGRFRPDPTLPLLALASLLYLRRARKRNGL